MKVKDAIEQLKQLDSESELVWHDAIEGNDCPVASLFLQREGKVLVSPLANSTIRQKGAKMASLLKEAVEGDKMDEITANLETTIKVIKASQKNLVESQKRYAEQIDADLEDLARIFNAVIDANWKEFVGDNSGLVYQPIRKHFFMGGSHTLDWKIEEMWLAVFLDNDYLNLSLDSGDHVFINNGEWYTEDWVESDEDDSDCLGKSVAVKIDLKVSPQVMENFLGAVSKDLNCKMYLYKPSSMDNDFTVHERT
jgi:hypothetical protein